MRKSSNVRAEVENEFVLCSDCEVDDVEDDAKATAADEQYADDDRLLLSISVDDRCQLHVGRRLRLLLRLHCQG